MRVTVATTSMLIAASVSAAGMGDRCKVPTTNPQYICPQGALCLQAIGNKYCSEAGKVCGWPDRKGYNLGKQKQYNDKWYECFANGFKRVYSSGASCTQNSQCKNHNCGGPVGQTTCGGTTPAPASPEQVIAGMKSAGQPVSSIVATVESMFSLGGASMATKLKAAGFTSSATGGALKGFYDPDLGTLGGWLLGAGWSASDVGATLKTYFNASAAQVATFLKNAGQGANATTSALRTAFVNVTATQAAAALKTAGYTAAAVISAIQAVFEVSIWVAGDAALTVGYVAQAVIDAMVAVVGMTGDVVRFTLDHTAAANEAALAASVSVLKQAGATATMVKEIAKETGKWTAALVDKVVNKLYGIATAPTAPMPFMSSSGVTIEFPDVCMTPTPAGPIPIPYPNIGPASGPSKTDRGTKTDIALKGSEFPAGSYRLSSGEVLVIGPDSASASRGAPPLAKVAVVDSSNKAHAVARSALLQLPDGKFCAVCMLKGQVTSIRLLTPTTKTTRTKR